MDVFWFIFENDGKTERISDDVEKSAGWKYWRSVRQIDIIRSSWRTIDTSSFNIPPL